MPHIADPGQPGDSIHEALVLSSKKRPCGLYFDFDGVLAPIQAEPDAVNPVPGVVDALANLAALVDRVGIISARPVQFLARHFGKLRGVPLFGLYGIETAVDGIINIDPEAQSWIPTIRTVEQDARRDLPNNIFIEDKRLSVSLHYRLHPEFQAQAEEWASAKAREYGLREQRGRMVIELKPPVSIDKGTVLSREVSNLSCAWYLGDDISDIKGFEALRKRHEENPDFLAVCVAVRNAETGQELEEQADFILSGPNATPALLTSAITIFSLAKAANR
jgi:trehalose 6-phosphate phosphatase